MSDVQNSSVRSAKEPHAHGGKPRCGGRDVLDDSVVDGDDLLAVGLKTYEKSIIGLMAA